MPNQHVQTRLMGIQAILNGIHQASAPMSNNTTGTERQAVIDSFLSAVFPNQYRFGTGDATDRNGNRSGQLDVVIENAFSPSLPIPAAPTRLYLAESIAAVIEVKSNIAVQWEQAVKTANQLAPLARNFGGGVFMGDMPTPYIPLFIVSYTGWSQMATLQAKLIECANIDGILIIDQGLFLSSARFGVTRATGSWALMGLIASIHQATHTMMSSSFNPLSYGL
jgi:hypothetical protein